MGELEQTLANKIEAIEKEKRELIRKYEEKI